MSNEKKIALSQGVIGGILAGIALSQYGFFLMPFAIALLWPASKSPLAGGAWGGLAVLISHSWILGLHPLTWIGISPSLSLVITFFIWFFCGTLGFFLSSSWCFLGLSSYFDCSISKSFKRRFLYAIFMSSVWGIAEVLLSHFPFFWVGIGTALLPNDIWLTGLARLSGAGGMVVIQFLIAWWIWQTVVSFNRGKSWQIIFLIGFICVLFLHGLGWYLLAKPKQQDSYSIALWQTAIPTREKFSIRVKEAIPSALKNALNEAKEMGASLMIAPEGTINLGQRLLSPAPIPLLAGGFRLEDESLRSSILVFNKNQQDFSDFLDKHRLVPLGEWSPSFLSIAFKSLSALGGIQSGTPSRTLFWDARPFSGAICYELSDGNALAKSVAEGGQWIVSIANLDPYPLLLQKQYISLAQLRSIETRRDLVIAANTGPTALISSNGIVTPAIDPLIEGIGLVKVNFQNEKTTYTRFRELPLLVLFSIGFISSKPFSKRV